MGWIKRNLYFVIGTAVAVALMGVAGWYLYSNWQLNNQKQEELKAEYEKLDRLNKENPHPGSGQIDNIKTAKEQRQQLTNYLAQARRYFQRISPIPDGAKVTSQEYSALLGRTIGQMQHGAVAASVTLPAESSFAFSFLAQRNRVTFPPGSLEPLAMQLGEVRAICEVLFQARINALDSVRRERVTVDDVNGPPTDYVAEKSVTNELAVLTPYELTFRCFSTELASALAGFAGSPYGLVVKTINVELASAPIAMAALGEPGMMPGPPGIYPGYAGNPAMTAPAPSVVPGATPTVPKGGLPTVLDEKQLRVTLVLDVVKLLAPK